MMRLDDMIVTPAVGQDGGCEVWLIFRRPASLVVMSPAEARGLARMIFEAANESEGAALRAAREARREGPAPFGPGG